MEQVEESQIHGPFLRFDNYVLDEPNEGEALWTGSVLYILNSTLTTSLSPICHITDNHRRKKLEGVRIDDYGNWGFWRFDLEFVLGEIQRKIVYKLEGDTTEWTFFLPSATQNWRLGAYSCSGFSHEIDPKEWMLDGDHPLVAHLLKRHKESPMHVNIGGGDQLYNDGVFEQKLIHNWLNIRDRHRRHTHPFTDNMKDEAEQFYFANYCTHFGVKSLKEMVASIPNVMLWDDHDIFDGWGSYPSDMLNCPVFKGIFVVARKFYLLFQHHTNLEELIGDSRDFFGTICISKPSFSFLKYFGPNMALLGVDIRSERTKSRIVSEDTWKEVFRQVGEISPRVKHLIVLFTVPIVYPKFTLSELALEAVSYINRIRILNAILVKTNILSFMMKWDEPGLLDDLVDHWNGIHHGEERKKVVEKLQQVAVKQRLRITFLSGDVHCAGLGRFYSYPKIEDAAFDPYFMPQVITSALINAPPPHVAVKLTQSTDHAGNRVNSRTREKMVRFFKNEYPDQEKTLARRNFATFEMLEDGLTMKVSLHIEDNQKDMMKDPVVFDSFVPALKDLVEDRPRSRPRSFTPDPNLMRSPPISPRSL